MRPTFEDKPVSYRVEPYLLDLNRNLYGQEIKLEFVQRLRPEQRFSSASLLISQMQQDVQQTREVLNHVP
jgi:riboflavin kinase/FMN adenylyltransferase